MSASILGIGFGGVCSSTKLCRDDRDDHNVFRPLDEPWKVQRSGFRRLEARLRPNLHIMSELWESMGSRTRGMDLHVALLGAICPKSRTRLNFATKP